MTFLNYEEYLKKFKDKIYVMLCLYEEKSSTFDSYMLSLVNVEMHGLSLRLKEEKYNNWFDTSYSILIGIAFQRRLDFSDVDIVKKEAFTIMKLIDQDLKRIKGK